MSVIDTLITDRTQADVDWVKRVISGDFYRGGGLRPTRNGSFNPSATLRAEYMAGMKGAYNYTDLNRVGNAVLFIKDRVQSLLDGIDVYNQSHPERRFSTQIRGSLLSQIHDVKTDWSVEDIPNQIQMNTYVSNVRSLITAVFAMQASIMLQKVPKTMNALTYVEANGIEHALVVANDRVGAVEAQFEAFIGN